LPRVRNRGLATLKNTTKTTRRRAHTYTRRVATENEVKASTGGKRSEWATKGEVRGNCRIPWRTPRTEAKGGRGF